MSGAVKKYDGYRYIVFSFGEDDATAIDFASYDNLNEVEKKGLNGLLESLQYLTALASPTPNMSDVSALIARFNDMGESPDKNSELARILYLTEAHSYFKTLQAWSYNPFNPNFADPSKRFDAVNETTIDPNHNNNIYSNVFSFASYGDRLATYFDL